MGTEVAKESSERLQQAAKDSSEILKTVSVETNPMFPTLKEKGTKVGKETSEKLHSLEDNDVDKVTQAFVDQGLNERGREFQESMQKAHEDSVTAHVNFGRMIVL